MKLHIFTSAVSEVGTSFITEETHDLSAKSTCARSLEVERDPHTRSSFCFSL